MKNSSIYYDSFCNSNDDGYYCRTIKDSYVINRNQSIDNNSFYPHYSNPRFSSGKTATIFKNYNKQSTNKSSVYSDRLNIDFWNHCINRTSEFHDLPKNSAVFFEQCLKYYYNSDNIILNEIQVGVNVGNGYPYTLWIFSYDTISSNVEKYQAYKKTPEYLNKSPRQ